MNFLKRKKNVKTFNRQQKLFVCTKVCVVYITNKYVYKRILIFALILDKPLSKFAQNRGHKAKPVDTKSSNIVIGEVIEKCNDSEINDFQYQKEKLGFPKPEIVDKKVKSYLKITKIMLSVLIIYYFLF